MDYNTCDLNDLQSLVSKEPLTHYTCDCHTKSCIYSRTLFCSGCGKSIANNIQDIHKELDEIHAAEQVLLFRKAVESVKKFKIETLTAFGLNEDSEICFRVVDLYGFAWRQRWRKVAGIDNCKKVLPSVATSFNLMMKCAGQNVVRKPRPVQVNTAYTQMRYPSYPFLFLCKCKTKHAINDKKGFCDHCGARIIDKIEKIMNDFYTSVDNCRIETDTLAPEFKRTLYARFGVTDDSLLYISGSACFNLLEQNPFSAEAHLSYFEMLISLMQ